MIHYYELIEVHSYKGQKKRLVFQTRFSSFLLLCL